MSIDILVLGVPALAERLLEQRAADRGWTLHRPGSDGLAPPEVAGRIVAVAASTASTPASIAAWERKVTRVEASAPPYAPNIGR